MFAIWLYLEDLGRSYFTYSRLVTPKFDGPFPYFLQPWLIAFHELYLSQVIFFIFCWYFKQFLVILATIKIKHGSYTGPFLARFIRGPFLLKPGGRLMGQHVSHSPPSLYENLFPQPLAMPWVFWSSKKIDGAVKQCLKLTVASATSEAFPKWKDPLCKHQFSSASAISFKEGKRWFLPHLVLQTKGLNFWHKWHLGCSRKLVHG